MHPFRAAVEARDLDAMAACLAEDVRFSSPVVFKPYEGRDVTMVVLRAVFEVFEDFAYTDEIESDGTHALLFSTRVGD
ncbi:MAG TPA: nuclear transport factor 2 family protein, partial [Solirubrobacteraceae bacterium]